MTSYARSTALFLLLCAIAIAAWQSIEARGADARAATASTALAALQVEDSVLRVQLDSSRARAERDSAAMVAARDTAHRATARYGVTLRSAGLAVDTLRMTDTVRVPVTVLVSADQAIRSCSAALTRCDSAQASLRSERDDAKRLLSVRSRELEATRVLIPTPAQRRVHDVKVGVVTVLLYEGAKVVWRVIRPPG